MTAQPPTLWHTTARLHPNFGTAEGALECDLLVIGGGFTGLSTALHAAQFGQKIILLEAQQIAWGATGRNAGFVVPNFAKVDPAAVIERLGAKRGAALNDFAAGSADLVFELVRRHAIDCDARQVGWIQPAHSPAALASVRSRAKQWRALNRPAEDLGRDEVAALAGIEGYLGGWIDRSGGVLNPVAYARGLALAATAAGAHVFEYSSVLNLDRAPSGWLARTAKATVHAKRVILAVNAYARRLVPGLAQSFFPLQVYQIATPPLPSAVRARFLPEGQCLSDTRRNLFTFRFDAEDRLISGGMNIVGIGADKRVPRHIHRRVATLLDLPDLPPPEYSWSGEASVMPDFLPRLVEIGPGLVAGFACNGRGIAMTTRLGREHALWASGTPLEDLSVPSGPSRSIFLHSLAKYAPRALLPYSMLKDWIDARHNPATNRATNRAENRN